MKTISFIVPCFNSEGYMGRCVDSILTGGDDIEIIIVDDGSTDRTGKIADEYKEKYPDIVKVIHKENGGHGSGINYGLKEATGTFLKVVDSDDRLDEDGLKRVLEFLRDLQDDEIDMLLTNYVYDKAGSHHKFVMKPKGIPKDRMLTWDSVKRIRKYHFILMHSIIYRTALLRGCGLELPEHTYYVDNIYAFQPLPFVRKFCYKDIDLYWYFIGREGQSVSEEKLVKQIDQYIKVVKIMTEIYRESRRMDVSRVCLRYMLSYLEIVFAITCNYLNAGKTKEYIEKKKQLWKDVREIDEETARHLRRRFTLIMTNLPGRVGRALTGKIVKILSSIMGLN